MKHIQIASVRDVINRCAEYFDTHQVEQLMLRFHTAEMGEELASYKGKRKPLTEFSANFSKWLGQKFKSYITKAKSVTSRNLGGKRSKNQSWHKIDHNQAIP